jgi:uncharacterized membrane protein YuzA (DUF378 family)
MTVANGWTKAMLALVVIGAINWGLIGFFNWNLVDAIFGGGAREETSAMSRVIYAAVGLAGLATLAGVLARAPRGPERLSPRRPVAS